MPSRSSTTSTKRTAQRGQAHARRSVAAPRRRNGPTVRLVVVGAHLEGLPLNHQLLERGAMLERACATRATYRLHLLPEGRIPRPGLVRVADGGAAIQVEVWLLPKRHLADFVCAVDPPLSIGTVALQDGSQEKGFLCEHYAAVAGEDITRFGGWRAYLEAQ